jgi:hypothetical protein
VVDRREEDERSYLSTATAAATRGRSIVGATGRRPVGDGRLCHGSSDLTCPRGRAAGSRSANGDDRTLTGVLCRSGPTGRQPVALDVAEIPRLAGNDRPPAPGADGQPRVDRLLHPRANLLVSPAVASRRRPAYQTLAFSRACVRFRHRSSWKRCFGTDGTNTTEQSGAAHSRAAHRLRLIDPATDILRLVEGDIASSSAYRAAHRPAHRSNDGPCCSAAKTTSSAASTNEIWGRSRASVSARVGLRASIARRNAAYGEPAAPTNVCSHA